METNLSTLHKVQQFQNYRRKSSQEQLSAVNEEKQNIIGPESTIYEMGPGNHMGSDFHIQKTLQPSTFIPLPTSNGPNFQVNSTTTTETLPRFSSGEDIMREQTNLVVSQSQQSVSTLPLALMGQYRDPRISSSATQDGIHYSNNTMVNPITGYEQEQPWILNTCQVESSCNSNELSQSRIIQQQQSHRDLTHPQRTIEHSPFHHQTSTNFDPSLWHPTKTGGTVLQQPLQQPAQQTSQQPLMVAPQFQRRSSHSNPSPLPPSNESSSEPYHRPRARSVAMPSVSRLPDMVSMSTRSSSSHSSSTPGVGVEAMRLFTQSQSNYDDAAFSQLNLAGPSSLEDVTSHEINTTQRQNNNVSDSSYTMNTTKPAAFREAPFMNSGGYSMDLDLATLLSTDIGDLGLQKGPSPSLTQSTVSSPSPSASSSSNSPSPTISNASAATPMESAHSLEHSSYFHSRISCPVDKCPCVFSRVSDLEDHFRSQHSLNLKDVVLSRVPLTRSFSSPPLSAYESYRPKSISSSPPLPASLHPTPVSTSFTTLASVVSSKGGCSKKNPLHSKVFPCHLCPRVFARKHDLQRHIRVHTGSKPYLCMNCQKSFARTDALSRHYKIEAICREAVAQMDSDHEARKQQQNKVQQKLHMEVKELKKAHKQRQHLQNQHEQYQHQHQHQHQHQQQQFQLQQPHQPHQPHQQVHVYQQTNQSLHHQQQ